ncbi:RdgB/HAM1 family non-canonical purine NTP pyrophosphatase [Intestinicryptomonas porci]|uniref:dITP/XTP pyrophosphatase n=1 Tax=Intestinicryptomonas porci TaxID=2926320 RepID=A0ABU4WEV6_9BACT|nr:RdgB/HAM1 family non-canonical purine NTP pyrophosphatase [Opitutales bacterium CLA-KB-P66]
MNSDFQKISEIKSLPEGSRAQFCACAILKSLQKRLAKNGSEFLVADFADNSGSMTLMVFADSLAYISLTRASAGDAFKIFGVADFYNGRFSPKIDSMEKLSEEELQSLLGELVEVAPENADAMRAELFSIIEKIPNPDVRETVKYALNDVGEVFFRSTAAIKMHHAYVCGLLEHSLHLARLAVKLLPMYPFVNPSLAIAGAVLHDIGKTIEYSQGLATEKTKIGILQGHVVLGFRIVRKAALKCKLNEDLTGRLEHIILSHQGELQWGAAAVAATPEAVFVSMLDYLDARMGAVYSALKTGGDGEFTDLVPALQTRILQSKPDDEFAGAKVEVSSGKKIFIATSNAHKVKEIKAMFEEWGVDCDVGGADEIGGMPECDENADTFEGNAFIKADALKKIAPADAYVLADDSGIVVDALGGNPGIHSARYAGVKGEGADKANNEKLLKALENIPDGERSARFVCVLALVCPNGERKSFEGRVEGFINHGAKGKNGFGYDPLFELPEGMTTAELPEACKNEISHRARALKELIKFLKTQ